MNDFELVKQRIDVSNCIVEETGLTIQMVGEGTGNLSECPFCQGHDCFRIKTKEQFWKCFQCDQKGDIFSFVGRFHHLNKVESLEYLARKYKVSLASKSRVVVPSKKDRLQPIKDRAFEILKKQAQSNFQNKLIFQGKQITLYDYLHGIRKCSSKTISDFEIVPSHMGLVALLEKEGFELEDIKKAGFANHSGTDYFPASVLLYPVLLNGQLSHFDIKDPTGRCKFKSKSLHRNSEALFFNMDSVERAGKCVVVEGCHDAISVIGKGGHCFVLATLGQLSERQIKWLVKAIRDKRMMLYLCFDNDDAGEVYTQKILAKLKSQSLLDSVRIIVFDGAKDIDEFLRGKASPQDDFQQLLAYAQRPPQGIYNIISKPDGYYRIKSETRHEPDLVVISNFTLSIVNEINTPDDCLREIQLKDYKGKKSSVQIFTSKELSSPQEFTHRLLKIGSYGFWGNSRDLKETLLFEMSKYSGRRIFLLNYVGYSESHGFWIFSNGIIKNQVFIPADQNNVVWVDASAGFRLQALNSSENDEKLPGLKVIEKDEAARVLDEFLDNIKLNLGGYEGWLAFGFVISSVYAPDIVKAHGFFPLLFLIGKHQSGKNVLASLILACYGISELEIESLPSARSPVGILRKLGYFSNCFVWLDEYRSHSKLFDGILRNAYNRVSRTTGVKNYFGTYRNPIRAIVGLSGEYQPQDPATRSRCVFVRLSALNRRDEYYPKIAALMPLLSGVFFQLLMQKTAESTQSFLLKVQAIKKSFIDEGLPAREAANYAIPAAAIDGIKPDSGFMPWVLRELKDNLIQSQTNSTVQKFLEDIYHLQIKGQLNHEYIKVQDALMFLWLRGVHSLWEETLQRSGKDIIPYDSLLNLFKEETYFYSHNKAKRMGAKRTPRKCLVLSLNGDSDVLSSIAEQARDISSGGGIDDL